LVKPVLGTSILHQTLFWLPANNTTFMYPVITMCRILSLLANIKYYVTVCNCEKWKPQYLWLHVPLLGLENLNEFHKSGKQTKKERLESLFLIMMKSLTLINLFQIFWHHIHICILLITNYDYS
jgi:hypothetical protein